MKCFCVFGVAMASLWNPGESSLYCQTQKIVFASVNTFHSANQNFDSTLNALHPMSLLTEKENNESYTFEQILNHPDADDFIHIMIKDTDYHKSRDHWDVVPRWGKPPDVKAILAIWYFKRKRFPDGRINKHKARICAHGGMQQYGVNKWETYSPTVNWISVHFLMIVAQVLDLDTQAIDFVLAFPQAELEVLVYTDLPAGMDLAGNGKDISKNLLKLKRSLYGLKQASVNWHCKLKTAFEDRGFVESISDPCVFISK